MSAVFISVFVYMNVTYFAVKRLKFDIHYSNWHAKGLSCCNVSLLAGMFHPLVGKTFHLEWIAVLESKFHFQIKD